MHVAGRSQARLRLGVRIVLSLEFNPEGCVSAQVCKTLVETLLLQCGLEEVRTGLGLYDPGQAVVPDAAAARSRARAGEYWNHESMAASKHEIA